MGARLETELRLSAPSHKQSDENRGLRTERQIMLYRQREAARRERAERREAEARVRHLNLALVERIVLLVLAVAVAIAVLVGALGDRELLRVALGTGALSMRASSARAS